MNANYNFLDLPNPKRIFLLILVGSVLLSSCATYKTKYAEVSGPAKPASGKTVSHTFYLIGDAGLSPMDKLNPALLSFKETLRNADKNSTAVFLGDNIYPAGLPDKKDSSMAYQRAKNHLDAQLSTLDEFKGRPLFIPGNHDWYNEGLKGLKREEDYIKKKIKSKNPFLPENGCPIEIVDIDDQTVLIAIDTEWYFTNWDKHPTINDGCSIKSRAKFWEAVESEIKKNSEKTTLIAMHHPMFTYGPHGGQFTIGAATLSRRGQYSNASFGDSDQLDSKNLRCFH